MRVIIDTLEPFDRDGSVDLRGGELAVAEELLHAAEVGAVVEEMGREGVAQLVGSEAGVEPGGSEVALEQELDGAAVELFALGGDEEDVVVEGAGVEIGLERADRGAADRAHALLAAFAEDADGALPEIEVAALEGHQFRETQPGAVEDFQPRDVAEHLPVLGVAAGLLFAAGGLEFFAFVPKKFRGLEQGQDLFLVEKDGEAARHLGQGEVGDGVRFHPAFAEGLLVEGAQGGEAESDGAGAELLRPGEAVEVGLEVGGLQVPPRFVRDGGLEFEEGLAVIADGVG